MKPEHLEKLGDRLFKRTSRTLYDDTGTRIRDLIESLSIRGLAKSSAFATAAAEEVFVRFCQLEDAFISSYIRLLRRSRDGITPAKAEWLRSKLGRVWEEELSRAKEIASHLCQATGLTASDVQPQIANLEGRGRDLKWNILNEIEIAAISQGSPPSLLEAQGAVQDEELGTRDRVPTGTTMPDPRKVFVIHGRDERLRKGMFDFLRAIDLAPLEWVEAVGLTQKAAPFVGEVLSTQNRNFRFSAK